MKTNCARSFQRSPGLPFIAVACLLCVWQTASAKTLYQFANEAISPDTAISTPAIAALRAAGPDGLQALLTTHSDLFQKYAGNIIALGRDETWSRLKSALDAVGEQRDCYASRLYWYTNFDQAEAAAEASGKPILSLRLLGNLDEELSCANSRFFRTTLYANAEVSDYLRHHFILHWKSVRPVPRITIDFGDGRKIERTITGNSIHYILAADGRVIDALPGLYGPKAFLQGLKTAEQIARQVAAANSGEREILLREYHRARIAALNSELESDLEKVSAIPIASGVGVRPIFLAAGPPTARAAATIAVSKSAVEMPILNKSLPRVPAREGGADSLDDSTWSRIAALHADDSRLDAGSTALMRAKNPSAFDAARLTATKAFVENPLIRQLRNLERSISEDTVRNEYQLHSRIHAWLANGEPVSVDELNKRVYAELFLTPDSDPWLGLLPPDTYAALENGGVSMTTKH
jgi:hypothetical protein